ncbi:MAG: conjugal transfer protein TraD [Alphaproteobacteria bacterium]|nr:conjugal transfer protein TraD [Alphaproteobacteria bacterium]
MMHKLEFTSRTARKARTRTLIEVGSLCEKAGVLKSFGIVLGKDLQKDPEMQEPVANLFNEFLRLAKTK